MVRNFWLDAKIDGRKTKLAGGPQRKDGGMRIQIYQRDCGEITNPITIYCVERDGELSTEITVDGTEKISVTTKR